MPGLVADWSRYERILENDTRTQNINIDARDWLKANYENLWLDGTEGISARERLEKTFEYTRYEIRAAAPEIRTEQQREYVESLHERWDYVKGLTKERLSQHYIDSVPPDATAQERQSFMRQLAHGENNAIQYERKHGEPIVQRVHGESAGINYRDDLDRNAAREAVREWSHDLNREIREAQRESIGPRMRI